MLIGTSSGKRIRLGDQVTAELSLLAMPHARLDSPQPGLSGS